MSTFASIKNCCRACLSRPATSKMISLNTEASEKLFEISGYPEAVNVDEFPQYICIQCDSDLEMVHNFIRRVKFSKVQIEQHLHQILEIKKIDPFVLNDTYEIRHLNSNEFDIAEETKPETNGESSSILDTRSMEELQTIVKLEENPNLDGSPKLEAFSTLYGTQNVEATSNLEFTFKLEVAQHMNIENVKPILEGESSASATISCHICDKVFRYRANMLRHVREHQGHRFRCHFDKCDSSFTQKSSLKVHIGNHIGIKEHTCEICSRSFSQKKTLTLHRRVHTGESPYVCDNCGHSFKQKTNLIRHFKSRCDKAPKRLKRFQCYTCSGYFASNQSLRRHVKRHERVDPELYNPIMEKS